MSKFDASKLYAGQHLKYTRVNEIIEAIAALEANRSEAITKESYQELVTWLSEAQKEAVMLGQSIYIKTIDVPDVWIYRIENSQKSYTYTTDEAFITALSTGNLQIGYFTLAALETEKPNLTIYQEKTIIEYIENIQDEISIEPDNKNHEFRLLSPVSSIQIGTDEAILNDAEFIEGLVFKTRKDTDANISYISQNPVPIKYLGTDTSEGTFYPQRGIEYDLTFYFDGISLKCLVSGVPY